jgi:pilus assembly protein TadC
MRAFRKIFISVALGGNFIFVGVGLVIILLGVFVTVTPVQADLQGREGLVGSRFGTVNIDVGPYVQWLTLM